MTPTNPPKVIAKIVDSGPEITSVCKFGDNVNVIFY